MAEALEALAEAVARGERAAVARALNLTEDRRASARPRLAALLAALRHTGKQERAHRIGITGPPGVGKSTLVAAVARSLRAAPQPRSVAVLAVDPSSVRSGGALLGDRARIAPDPTDAGLFVRSLATAGQLGGLAPSVQSGMCVLATAFDLAVLETVGVGQTETDVRQVVDTVVFVVQPGAGDELSYMKAGVMEVPDLLVVNKADLAEAGLRARSELASALVSLRAAGIARREVPLLSTSAREGAGVGELVAALASHHAVLLASGELAERRRAGNVSWALSAFVRRFGEFGVERAGGEAALRKAVAARLEAGEEAITAVEALGAVWAPK